MKKLVSLILIFTTLMIFAGNVYASSCKVSLSTAKTTLSKGDEFVVDVTLSDIDAENGIIALIATLEYDKDSLDFVEMKSQNNWSRPEYNKDNGKFVMEKGDYVKEKENILKITFKVKETSKENLEITLKDIVSSNAKEDIKSVDSSLALKVSAGSKPTPISNTTNTTNTNNNGGGSSSTKNDNKNTGSGTENRNTNKNTTNTTGALKNGKLPKAGTSYNIVLYIIFAVTVIATGFYARIKIIDKKKIDLTRKDNQNK